MDPARFFVEYAADRRRETIASFTREDLGHLVRHTAQPPQTTGLVAFASLTPGAEDRQIREQVDHFERIGQGFEWKVYGLDRPSDLRDRLMAAGFMADDEETFMVRPLDSTFAQRPARSEVRRVVDEAGLLDVMTVQRAVWGDDLDWLHLQLSERLVDPDAVSIYCAYRDRRPVGSGWTDFPAGSRFPELHGGSVVADARCSGVYADLFGVRLAEAADRGYAHITVDASPMSRTILAHIGFEAICSTAPMRSPPGRPR